MQQQACQMHAYIMPCRVKYGSLSLSSLTNLMRKDQPEAMIDRRYHRSLQVFSWVACGAMTAKLVLFTEYGTRRGHGEHEHVFTGVNPDAFQHLIDTHA